MHNQLYDCKNGERNATDKCRSSFTNVVDSDTIENFIIDSMALVIRFNYLLTNRMRSEKLSIKMEKMNEKWKQEKKKRQDGITNDEFVWVNIV